MRDSWAAIVDSAVHARGTMERACPERFCPRCGGELERIDGTRLVRLVCRPCGYVHQLPRSQAPPRREDAGP